MHQFRKRPVVIEAFQMTRERRADNSEWPSWLNEAWNRSRMTDGALFPIDYPDSDGTDELCIYTLEGLHRVSFGDWIIQGVKGELYPCKPEIFDATYEPFCFASMMPSGTHLTSEAAAHSTCGTTIREPMNNIQSPRTDDNAIEQETQ